MCKAKRRLAFWFCYLAIVFGSTAPARAQSCPEECWTITSLCACVGGCEVECWWLGGSWICSACDWDWAIKMYSRIMDGGPECPYTCCVDDFLICTLEPPVAPFQGDR